MPLRNGCGQWNRSQDKEVAMVPPRIWFPLVCALSSAAAGAATTQQPAAAAFGTRAQLRECLDLDDALKARARALEATTLAINQKILANQAEAAQLADAKKTLDRSDKAAIASFNQQAMAHNQHVQQADDDASGADAVRARLDADKADMDQQCGRLTYRPADVDAVDKERRKAAALAAAASAP
jgi:hypothetical protein